MRHFYGQGPSCSEYLVSMSMLGRILLAYCHFGKDDFERCQRAESADQVCNTNVSQCQYQIIFTFAHDKMGTVL